VRVILLGLILLPALAVTILSMRPGGLRQQLRHVRRRLKIFLVLAGIYLAVSTAARLALPDSDRVEIGLGVLGAILAVIFVVLAQDPTPARS
jgi:hypothetical protein